MTYITQRKSAKEQGLTRYFTGKPCLTAGHISERSTRNGECLECAKERLAKWRVSNPEKKSQNRRKNYLLNKEKEHQQHKNWILSHPEKKEEFRLKKNHATSIWAKNNKDKKNANEAKRRAAILNRTPFWLNDWHLFEIESIYKYCNALRLIGLDYHVDHIVPLQGEIASGFHVPWNLQVIPAFDNLSKNNRMEQCLVF